jgi:hypothetical protein
MGLDREDGECVHTRCSTTSATTRLPDSSWRRRSAWGLWLVLQWGGSMLQRRPVREILVGWHVERGYMWPYVLLAYLLVPLLLGVTIHPGH